MPVLSDVQMLRAGRRSSDERRAWDLVRLGATACILIVAGLTSAREDWQPVELVLALTTLMLVADILPVAARRIRLTAGLLVQVVAMAVLGPAPAVVIGVVATIGESIVNRVTLSLATHNTAIFAFLGLAGGLAFDAVRAGLGLDARDTAYALLVMPAHAATPLV